MGKPKKGRRGDVSDDDESVTNAEPTPVATKKGEKKKKGKKAKDDVESGSEPEVEPVDSTSVAKKEKKKKKGKKKHDDTDDDSDADQLSSKMQSVKIDDDADVKPPPKPSQKKAPAARSAFSMLTSMDSDVDVDDDGSNEDIQKPQRSPSPEVTKSTKIIEPAKKGKKGKQSKKEEDLDEVLAEFGIEIKEKESKKKKKAKKKKGEEEEEADADDAAVPQVDLESKEAVVVVAASDDSEGESRKERRKKKKKGQKEDLEEPATIVADAEEKRDDEAAEETVVKSAAQKRQEKKERERLKKLEEKQKAEKKSQATKKEEKLPESIQEPVSKPAEEVVDDEEKDDKKDGKKSKKKGAIKKEEDDKGKKGPSKKALLAMQEAVKRMKEEEEAQEKAEEERIRLEEERENLRLEKIRLEKERKEREKQKKKERIERAKKQGTYLTAKQKEQRARAQAMLEGLKAQGAQIPALSKDERPDDEETEDKVEEVTAKSPKKIAKQIEEVVKAPPAEPVEETLIESPIDTKPVEKEEVKESWDQDSEDDVKDSWEQVVPGKILFLTSATFPSDSLPSSDDENKVPPAKQEVVAEESEKSSEEEESESESDSEEESEEDDKKTEAEKRRERAIARIAKRRRENEANRSTDHLRQPVVCVLGHVDTGKTKILDKLRRTNVQEGEAGGITQQIGATNVPVSAIEEKCKMVLEFDPKKLKLPGLLIIDTPGHESFSNLRSRGSSLCDIAVLVVDIMHGLEPQTIESINLLKKGGTPFVVALNKIDRLYDWKTNQHKDVRDVIKGQATNTRLEFEKRAKEVILGLAEQGLNAALFWENPDPRKYVSMIPTSAVCGDGMGNLVSMLVHLTQTMLAKRIAFSEELQATVLEVKALPGLGTTIDVILVNGTLRKGDTIIVAGTEGPVVAQIRSLLMPQPMKELRVKNAYKEHAEVKAAQGVKLCATDLEKAIAGLNLLVANQPDEVEVCKEEVAKELKKVLSSIKLQERGVYVQASTLGSLEALLEFLKSSEIPYSGIRIGPVAKRDVMRASVQLEHDSQYAVILAFDVKVEREAQEYADAVRVRIFQANIIYHLFDHFMAYREELKQKRRRENEHLAFIFNTRDPIVIGVSVEAGILKVGTPLCVPSKEFVDIGVVASIQLNNKDMEIPAKKGQEVCVKIENRSGDAPKMFGRHFEATDTIVSRISRESIDACKEFFRDDLQKPDWQLMIELKKLFQIL
ncbi:unnamed protein product [Notodromas monacha]|uniref:Eukaryotic translation initiation factor 5B n=1 Tax=Notodromas monacha TaxID=399045 RepID=A0A7R9GAL4_9CRUS|nr:unnamed protein product [Notodromas monacha]CAG0913882.1 unnamed protein product [Notodromas monacha]